METPWMFERHFLEITTQAVYCKLADAEFLIRRIIRGAHRPLGTRAPKRQPSPHSAHNADRPNSPHSESPCVAPPLSHRPQHRFLRDMSSPDQRPIPIWRLICPYAKLRVALTARFAWINPFARHGEAYGAKLRPVAHIPYVPHSLCYTGDIRLVKKVCPRGRRGLLCFPYVSIGLSVFHGAGT